MMKRTIWSSVECRVTSAEFVTRHMSLVIASVGLVLFALGCRSGFSPPKIELRGVNARGGDQLGVNLIFHNPNRFALDVTSLEYRVSIETLVCGDGRRDSPLRIGARDSTSAEFPLRLDYPNLVRAIPALLGDSVAFRVDGNLTVQTILGPRKLDFRQEKRLALKSQLESLLQHFFQ